jgi:hypothetical protein
MPRVLLFVEGRWKYVDVNRRIVKDLDEKCVGI